MRKAVNILVGRKKVEWVAHNYELSEHTKLRIVQRDSHFLSRNFTKSIQNSPLAWKTYTGCICIALNLYEYIVVDIDNERKVAKIVTFATTKDIDRTGDVTVIDRLLMNYREFMEKGE